MANQQEHEALQLQDVAFARRAHLYYLEVNAYTNMGWSEAALLASALLNTLDAKLVASLGNEERTRRFVRLTGCGFVLIGCCTEFCCVRLFANVASVAERTCFLGASITIRE